MKKICQFLQADNSVILMRFTDHGTEGDMNAKRFQKREHQSYETVQDVKEIAGIQISLEFHLTKIDLSYVHSS